VIEHEELNPLLLNDENWKLLEGLGKILTVCPRASTAFYS
jgi:hypothetical protein